MSVKERINDIFDSENPSQELGDILVSLVDEKNPKAIKEAFDIIEKTPKLKIDDVVAAINTAYEAIIKIEDIKEQTSLLAQIAFYLANKVSLHSQLKHVIDKFKQDCEESNNFNYLANFYKNLSYEETKVDDVLLERYLNIGELYAKAENVPGAQDMLHRSNEHLSTELTPAALRRRYDNLSININILCKKYVDVAYTLLSNYNNYEEDHNNDVLKRTILFVIASPPGPDRRNIIAQLSKEDEALRLPIFDYIRMLSTRQLISKEQIDELNNILQTENISQKVVAKNILEHNLAQISYLYSVVSFERIGEIVGVDPLTAFSTFERMIQNNTIRAKIDQPNGMVIYEKDTNTKEEEIIGYSEALDNLVIQIKRRN